MNSSKEKLLKKQIAGLDAKELLLSVDRIGMKDLVASLETEGYFKAQAAKKYHCNYEGGLVDHSLSVYVLFNELLDKFGLELSKDSRIIVSLLHDYCKVDENKKLGHAIESIRRIEIYVCLTYIEREIIRFHMGMYGTEEFVNMSGWGKSEYSLRDLTMAFNSGLPLLFYFCDHLTTKYIEPVR